MDSDLNPSNKNNINEYNSTKELWESKSDTRSDKVLPKAIKYLNKIPTLVGTGPFTAIILDLKTSQIKGCVGNFKDIFGISYQEDMLMEELVSSIYPPHNALMAKHFPTYINHILTLSAKERTHVDLSVIFKYKRGDEYYWLSFRAFKYFSKKDKNLGYVILEYTDITNVKSDKYARYIVHDTDKGYIVNEALHINCSTLDILTPTELIITKMISQGLSDKEIAAHQESATDTIKQHKKHIFSKLGINKSTELVAIAYECGLVS